MACIGSAKKNPAIEKQLLISGIYDILDGKYEFGCIERKNVRFFQ